MWVCESAYLTHRNADAGIQLHFLPYWKESVSLIVPFQLPPSLPSSCSASCSASCSSSCSSSFCFFFFLIGCFTPPLLDLTRFVSSPTNLLQLRLPPPPPPPLLLLLQDSQKMRPELSEGFCGASSDGVEGSVKQNKTKKKCKKLLRKKSINQSIKVRASGKES